MQTGWPALPPLWPLGSCSVNRCQPAGGMAHLAAIRLLGVPPLNVESACRASCSPPGSTNLACCMAGVCQKMLGWARRVSAGSTGDMLELYCGNGNFTVALADNFRWAPTSAINPHRRCCCGKADRPCISCCCSVVRDGLPLILPCANGFVLCLAPSDCAPCIPGTGALSDCFCVLSAGKCWPQRSLRRLWLLPERI